MSISITEGLNFEPILGYSPSTLSILLDLSIPALARDRAVGCLGSLPFVKIGRKVIYPKAAVQEWLKFNIQYGRSATQPEGPRSPGRPKGTTKVAIATQLKQSRNHQEPEGKEVEQ